MKRQILVDPACAELANLFIGDSVISSLSAEDIKRHTMQLAQSIQSVIEDYLEPYDVSGDAMLAAREAKKEGT